MSQPRDILVITTNEPADKKIKKHLKPITSHVVAGTNIFSDIFASWSDVFGGRSSSYQKQLTGLYKEAVERLQLEAYQLGADCIVGLKIDIDEISGGGKSMFMITAIGTAAIYENFGKSKSSENIIDGGVSLADIEDMRTQKTYIKKAKQGVLELDRGVWEYLIANKVSEVYPYLLKKFQIYFDLQGNYPTDELQSFKENFKAYLGNLQRESQIKLLYNTLEKEEVGVYVEKLLFFIIKSYNLLDIEKIWRMLKSGNIEVNKRALSLLKYDKPFYTNKDVVELEELSQYIKSEFKKVGEYTTKKQMLTRKEVEVWKCKCGRQNTLDYKQCVDCKKDIYGFYKEETNPIEAEQIILEKIDLIKKLLPSENQAEIIS